MERLGLFPLGLVLMPSERIPLHIFEPRYRQLIGECLERDDEFGIVLTRPDGDIHRIGTRTAVIDVLERMPDGRLNILVEGRERFSVVEVEHTDSYAIATVEPFADRDDPPPADVLARLEAAYRQLQQAAALFDFRGHKIRQPPSPPVYDLFHQLAHLARIQALSKRIKRYQAAGVNQLFI